MATLSQSLTTPIHRTPTAVNNSLRYSSPLLRRLNIITFPQNLTNPKFLRVTAYSSSSSTMSIAGAPFNSSSQSSSFLDCSSLQFVKYHGLGNDFILVDNRDTLEPKITPVQAVKLCDRNIKFFTSTSLYVVGSFFGT